MTTIRPCWKKLEFKTLNWIICYLSSIQCSKTVSIFLVSLILIKISFRIFNLNWFKTISNIILMSWKVWEKMKLWGFALRWPCDLQARSQSVKVVYSHRSQWCLCAWQTSKKKLFKSLHVMSNDKVFATQDGRTPGQAVGWTDTAHYIDPYIFNSINLYYLQGEIHLWHQE